MSTRAVATPAHPTRRLAYNEAIEYVENWIEAEILTPEQHDRNVEVSIVDYLDGEQSRRDQRPWCGIRIAEVDFHTKNAGDSYMQVDSPFGIAVCAQVERCVLALLEGWNGDYERTGGWETDEEFDRLRFVFENAGHPAATRETPQHP